MQKPDFQRRSTPLLCPVQHYDWGHAGHCSLVAELIEHHYNKHGIGHPNHPGPVQPHQPYAELWMGTHPSGEALLLDNAQQRLKDYLQGLELPFLFKVLSIGKALSIQAHPDKTLAEHLNVIDPKNYRDKSHKPEMAIAITKFTAMCNFRSISEIQMYISIVPEFRYIVGEKVADDFCSDGNKNTLKNLFKALMTVEQSRLELHLSALITRLKQKRYSGSICIRENIEYLDGLDVVMLLYDQFMNDVGVLCPLLLNCVRLDPGQALFLRPNEPHAYISGDLVECMAQSDNVVRAGLTSKFRDTETLISMLTYSTDGISQLLPKDIDSCTRRYQPPLEFPEFALDYHTIKGGTAYQLLPVNGYQIALVCHGSATLNDVAISLAYQYDARDLHKGSIVLLEPCQQCIVTAHDDTVIYRCFPNSSSL